MSINDFIQKREPIYPFRRLVSGPIVRNVINILALSLLHPLATYF
jgi:hypothetical protein